MSVVPENPDSTPIAIEQAKALDQDPFFSGAQQTATRWFSRELKSKINEMDNISFLSDRLELVVDARGYKMEDLKCFISPTSIEVSATKQEANDTGAMKNMVMSRNYQLQQMLRPEQARCCLSQEGILLVSVPWQ